MIRRRLTDWLPRAQRWELPFTMTVVCHAVAIPTAGLLFFMNRAMNAEGQRLLGDVMTSRQETLQDARNAARLALETRLQAVANPAKTASAPWRQFQALLSAEDIAGALILDADGTVVFPILTLPGTDGEEDGSQPDSPAEIHELLEEHRTSAVLSGRFADEGSRLLLADAMSRPRLLHARSTSGRRLQPSALLAALEELPADHPRRAELLGSLRGAVTDYQNAMPSGQRLFLAGALEKLGAPVVLPFASAEAFSLEQAGYAGPPPDRQVFHATRDPGLFSIRLRDADAVVFMRRADLQSSLLAIAGPVLASQGLTASLLPHASAPGGAPLSSVALGTLLPGWDLVAYGPNAATAVAARIQRLKHLYLISAIGGCLLIGILAGWAIRQFALRARDTRMKQDFLPLVSHELKTPLTSIRLFVDSLDEGGLEEPERARTYLDFIRRENERLSRLVDNFLTFSSLGSERRAFEFDLIHPDEIADAVRSAVSTRVNTPDCQFQTSSASDLPLINADPGALTTALINLVDNALKYSRGGKQIVFSVTAEAASVVFAVTDNGIGMSRETMKHLGEKFYRDRTAAVSGQKGFGLGLHIVRSITQAHGGHLEIISTIGSGSRFALRLPAAPDEFP